MRHQGSSSTAGRWWASAGCVGLVIASAFIGATIYLGGPPTVGRRGVSSVRFGSPPAGGGAAGGLASGPDPMVEVGLRAAAGPGLVRRKGPPLWAPATSTGDTTDLDEGESATATVTADGSTPPPPPTTPVAAPSSPTTPAAPSSPSTRRAAAPTPTPPPPHRWRGLAGMLRPRGGGGGKEHRAAPRPPLDIDWDQILHSVNRSVLNPRLTKRLSELADLDPASLIRNTSSLVSFGMLAVDLFLLHNVQRVAFTEEGGVQLAQDPEVQALNSLFDGGHGGQTDGGKQGGAGKQGRSGVLGEVVGFLQGAVRGVVNLGRAYRRAHRARSVGPTPLDCIWTLYCRNLEKTAKISGPYGFLAKMNSLGLRLVLGEFAAEEAVDRLMYDMSHNSTRLDCDALFPRCGAEEAKRVVLATAKGERGNNV